MLQQNLKSRLVSEMVQPAVQHLETYQIARLDLLFTTTNVAKLAIRCGQRYVGSKTRFSMKNR